MTITELITELQKHDPTSQVVVNGYEGGFDDITNVTTLPLKLNVNHEWYYGAHEPEYEHPDITAIRLS
jgi:hypothetical protein